MDKRKPIFPVSYYQGQVENNDRLKQQLLPDINFKKNKVQVPPGWATTKIITSINSDKANEFLYDNEELSKQYLNVIESLFGCSSHTITKCIFVTLLSAIKFIGEPLYL